MTLYASPVRYMHALTADSQFYRSPNISIGRLPLLVGVSLLAHVAALYLLEPGFEYRYSPDQEDTVIELRLVENVEPKPDGESRLEINEEVTSAAVMDSISDAKAEVVEAERLVPEPIDALPDVTAPDPYDVEKATEFSVPTVGALQILKSGSEIIHAQSYMSPQKAFGAPKLQLGTEYLVKAEGKVRPRVVNAYRLPNGNRKVELVSALGKVQCFEVPNDDPLDEFDSSVWMHSHC